MNNYTDTVVIAIGRGLLTPLADDEYMDDVLPRHEWQQFQGEVAKAIEYHGGMIVQRPDTDNPLPVDQVGMWGGKQEPAAAFIALMPSSSKVIDLGTELQQIKTRYGQSAIGYITAPGTALFV